MDQRELANTCAWLDTLYGKATKDDGEVVVIGPQRNRVLSVHKTSSKQLVAAAKSMHKHPGCYAKINLMDYTEMMSRSVASGGRPVVGKQSEVRSVVSIHLDVDADAKGSKYVSRHHAKWCIEQMPLKPTLVINSDGDHGGFHVYWVLSRPVRIRSEADRDRVASIAKDWQSRLSSLLGGKLDSTANLDRVLRCVGVPRIDGGRVCMESCDFDSVYSIEDFVDAL